VNPILTLVLFFLISTSLLAQGRIDCNDIKSRILRQPIHYCVLLPEAYDKDAGKKYPVLYFLHGLGDNEQTLINTGAWDLIENLRQQHKIGDFLIVTPQGGRSFYINSAALAATDGHRANGRQANESPANESRAAQDEIRYSDFFLQELMPLIERKYRIRAGRASRGITGMSMGGYGALRFAFAYPALFGSVSAQSPALVTDSPQQINSALRSGSPLGEMLGSVFGDPINVAHWNANNPFLLARKNRTAISQTAIYFNCGSHDNYGFEKGAAALDRQLTDEKLKHEYHLYPGDHSLPYFLSHLAETMEFHSRAFAGKE